MTGFPTLSYTSTFEVKNPFLFLGPEKGPPFGGGPPVYAIIGYPFPPPPPPPPGTIVTQQPTAIHVTATYFTSLLGGFKASSIISLSDIRACKWVKTSFASKIKKKNYAIKFVSTVQADFVYADHACFESSLGALRLQSIVHITGDDQNNLVQVCLKQSEHFFYMPRYHSYRITISS